MDFVRARGGVVHLRCASIAHVFRGKHSIKAAAYLKLYQRNVWNPPANVRPHPVRRWNGRLMVHVAAVVRTGTIYEKGTFLNPVQHCGK